MYTKHRYREKLKKVATATLLVLILLAEAGEFFISKQEHTQKHHQHKEKQKVELKLEIPEHVPENHQEASLKVEKTHTMKKPSQRETLLSLDLDRAADERYSLNTL